jgi:branched-chain amino acid transport system permease protein
MFGQAIVNGIAFGSIYALVALSLVLVYKVSEVVNFANGELAMFCAYIGFVALDTLRLSYPVAFCLTLIFALAFGALAERLIMRRLQNAGHLQQVMATVGLGTLLIGVAGWIWKFDSRPFPDAVSGAPLQIGGVIFRQADLLRMGVAVVVALGLYVFFRFTIAGIVLRGIAENAGAARLMGVRVGRMTTLSWAIATLLGAIAGLLVAPSTFLEPLMMADVALKAFAAAVLGGLTSLPGAVLGGLLLGVIDNLVGTFLSQELRTATAFAIIVAVLAVRPAGLLGKPLVKQV